MGMTSFKEACYTRWRHCCPKQRFVFFSFSSGCQYL